MGILVSNLYQKCKPNEAMIISGLSAGQTGFHSIDGAGGASNLTIIVGGGALVLVEELNQSLDSFAQRV